MKTRLLVPLGVLLAVGALFLLYYAESPYKEFSSLDGRYKFVVTKRAMYDWLLSDPGDGSSFPGSVTLYDTKTGKRLGRKYIDTVDRAFYGQYWEGRHVIIAGERWDLPFD
jgi:hypothetical protein